MRVYVPHILVAQYLQYVESASKSKFVDGPMAMRAEPSKALYMSFL